MHGGRGGDSQRLNVTDEMTNQKSAKYMKESVEMICAQWHLYQNTGVHKAGS